MEAGKKTFLDIQNASETNTDFSCLSSIKELWISSKKPYQIPDAFVQLASLEKLIAGRYCILPQNIDKLASLRELWLKNETILNPPCSITSATSIRELDICYYEDIEPCPVPEWIFEMRQLEKIRFSVCRFTNISDKINQLKNLADLDFGSSFSDMQSFPDLSGLANLKHLIASGNSVQGQKLPPYLLFSQILEGIRNLQSLLYLDLSEWRPKRNAEWLVTENKKHSIPDIFGRYPNLEELHLCGMKMDFIPQSIFQLKKLKKLSLNDNRLQNEDIREIIKYLPNCIIDSDVVCYNPKKSLSRKDDTEVVPPKDRNQ